jgi:[acyl-carrier-protein] S-malonyltransferase
MAEGFACLFPGQGAQFVGMGRQLYEEFPLVRDFFAAAEEVLGDSLAKLCLEGPADTLTATKNAQPAIFTLSVAAWELLKKEGLSPRVVAGHSIGEYAALVCAGALDFRQGLRLVRLRGELMEQACQSNPGTMAAVLGLEDEQVRDICHLSGAAAANFNCPGQVVISGSNDSIAEAGELARQQGAKIIALSVSGAFHSPLMASAQEKLSEALRQAPISNAGEPVYCNVDALPHRQAEELRSALTRQVTSSVLWKQSLLNMGKNEGVTTFVEVGSEKVLLGMVKRTLPGAELLSVWDVASLKTAIARLGG